MAKVELTMGLARAAAKDAADRNMREQRRTVWSAEDYRIACCELERILPYRRKGGYTTV